MNTRHTMLAALSVSLLVSVSAGAQQINGVPGSPSATMTIPGDQLPAPPQKFGGKIERDATEINAVLAGAHRAAQGRSERALDHHRRFRLWRSLLPSAA